MSESRITGSYAQFGKVGPACRAGLYGSTSEGRVPLTGLRA